MKNIIDYKPDSISAIESYFVSYESFGKDADIINIPGEADKDHIHLVLSVDDNPDMRVYLREVLKDTYKIAEAEDGNQGLDVAFSQHPDLILTDVMMGAMDGIEFCQKLKENSGTRHIPVIMLTALTALEDKVRGLDNGADDYLEKPFNSTELLARIKNLLQQRKYLKDLFTKELKIEPTAVSISSLKPTWIILIWM